MEHHSPVEFPTAMRVHIALGVRDLERSLAFYRSLLKAEPVKVREGYAKFEVHEPPVNLTLNATAGGVGSRDPEHFGIQVKSTDEVVACDERMRAGGFKTMNEEGVTCCFAVQDKVWAVDPDDHRWEVFVVLEADAPVHSLPTGQRDPSAEPRDEAPCCGPAANASSS